jgi:hypothetical protein
LNTGAADQQCTSSHYTHHCQRLDHGVNVLISYKVSVYEPDDQRAGHSTDQRYGYWHAMKMHEVGCQTSGKSNGRSDRQIKCS